MGRFQEIDLYQKVLRARILKKRYPLVVLWHLSYKCNLRCSYCGFWEIVRKELDIKSIFKLIDELAACGTRFISFAGGEPLLREDIGEIVDYCRYKRIRVVIHTNGFLVKKKIEEIRNVQEVKLSLDGPKNINDAVRGKGSYDKVLEALEVCKKNNVFVNVSTVISKESYLHISYMLDFARKCQVGVYFHPADRNHSGDNNKKITNLCDPEEFKTAIRQLIDEKKRGHKFIGNSFAGLKHLAHWPEPQRIFCFLARVGCVVLSDGSIFICDNFLDYQKYAVPGVGNFKKSFNKLKLPHSCNQCWCGPIVDFNLAGNFNFENLVGVWKRYNKSY